VLKYFDAVSIAATVIRIIPPYNEEDPEIEIYYSFLDFFAKTKYEDIWFSYVGGFDELIEHMDHYIDGEPTLEAYKDYLKSYYSLFRRKIFTIRGSDNRRYLFNLCAIVWRRGKNLSGKFFTRALCGNVL
jgi:hypothetical protein